MRSRFRRILLFILGALCLASCEARSALRIDVDEDGGGTVQVEVWLDAEAAARTILFDTPAFGDLADAGWTFEGPLPQDDGQLIRATKEFSQADQLPGVIAEVAGPDGPLRDFELVRDRSFATQRWELTGTVDLRDGLASLSDSELTGLLGGFPLGYRPEDLALAAPGGQPVESVVSVEVFVHLPADLDDHNGEVLESRVAGATPTTTAPAPSDSATRVERVTRKDVHWAPSFADPNPLNLKAASKSSSLAPRLWRWAAQAIGIVGLCALAFVLANGLLDQVRERRRIARRKARLAAVQGPAPEPEVIDSGPPSPGPVVPAGADARNEDGADHSAGLWQAPIEPVSSAPVEGGAGAARPAEHTVANRRPAGLRLMVVETSGVLFAGADPVNDLLVPHVRARGSTLTPSQITDWYVARVVGGLPAADFWMGLGIMGDPVLLDDAYARRYELTEDVVEFLTQARDRGFELAAVGEEVPEWIGVFRQRFGLDEVISWWVSASELGVRPPHPGLLQAVARTTGIPPEQTMMIGRSVPMLDVARRQGCRTVQYAPDLTASGGGHSILRSFESTPASH